MSDPLGKIRNIQQSVQNRDVTKQASDVIAYIDGSNYLINPYLEESGVNIPLNDYVISWTSNYDIESMIPTGALTLVVPVQDKHLFELPGGNKVIKTMMEIRIFAKGFYFSSDGNTMYRQIFKGYITNVTTVDDNLDITYTITCRGSLGLLERMQIETSPATMSNAPLSATAMTSNQHNLDPYGMIAWTFVYSSMIDGFEIYGIQQAAMGPEYTNANGTTSGNPYYAAIEERYVAKWQALLYDLSRDVHIFGAPNVQDVISAINDNVKKFQAAQNPCNREAMAISSDLVGAESESTQVTDQQPFYQQLRGYHPEQEISTIQLFNGRVMSRLERLRLIVSLVGFEAYQDVDGGVVIKPPLYNLDVMNLINDGTVPGVPADAKPDPSLAWITEAQNPFVIDADLISPGETETEDEAGVRLTRMTVRGNYTPSLQFHGDLSYLPVAEDIDVAKLAQFGLRAEPPLEAGWLQSGQAAALYAYAASELALANRGFRTYTCTIPMRPELKLGFPVYFPHKDMYGYIKTLNMEWSKGADATTTITCDSLRFRPLFPEDQSTPVEGTQQQKATRFMTQQPNLVLQWTEADANETAVTKQGVKNPKLAGKIASLPLPQQLVVDQQIQMLQSQQANGMLYTPANDSATHSWRIQPDQTNAFTRPRLLNTDYYNTLRTVRPYTDDKGYELLGPFPWGRWKSLKDSISVFTIENPLFSSTQASKANPVLAPISAEPEVITSSNAFLFSGDSSEYATDTSSQLISTLVGQRLTVDRYKVFELSYNNDPSSTQGMAETLGASAPAQPTTNTEDNESSKRVDGFLNQQAGGPDLFTSILDTVPRRK